MFASFSVRATSPDVGMIRTVCAPVPAPRKSRGIGAFLQQQPPFALPIRTLLPTSRRDLVISIGPDFVDEQDRDAPSVDPSSRPNCPDRTSSATTIV